jgi:hypothetical protein
MLDDITTYYNNDSNEPLRHGYKRKHAVEIEVIAQCEVCGTYLTSDCEILIERGKPVCGSECQTELIKLMEDGL